MKLALVLPLFSEYPLRDYLGIELIYKALRENNHYVDRIDLNENLVDYLLSNKSMLQEMLLSRPENTTVEASPYSTYFERYLSHILAHDTAQSLKRDGLFDNFFRTVVLFNFDPGIFPDASFVEKHRQILDQLPVIKDFLASFSKAMIENHYDAVLLSVPHGHQLSCALFFSKTIKSLDQDAITIFGGSAITLTDDSELEHYVSNGFIDYYVKYSGEEKLLDLLVDLEEKEEIDQAALIKRDYVDINNQIVEYRSEFNRTSVPVLYSRGCYWGKCSYCNYIFLDSGKFTRKKLPVLLSELEQFSGKPVRVSLITESLTPHDAKIIAEGILEKNLKITWGSFIRVNRDFDAGLFSLLTKSGCLYSCVGVESVNNNVLEFLNKGYTREDVYAFFKSAREANFHFFQVNFMYGAPVADLNDELDNIEFISEFRETIGNIAFFHLEITKKSYLGQHLNELGIQIDHIGKRRAVRVDNIPFKPSLSERELMLTERSYGIAGEYFKIGDVKAGIALFLKQNPRTVTLNDLLLFKFNGGCYAGSLNSWLLREIPPDLFSALNSSRELQIADLKDRDLFTLFELGIIDTREIV